jgi:23S rRNA (pseudouridine1915-N3)-methyltransferase
LKIQIIAIGNKMPVWVVAGIEAYLPRFPKEYALSLTEIPLEKTSAITDANMEKAIKPKSWVVALDVLGKPWSTPELAKKLESWRGLGKPLCFLIGGPEGLSKACLALAQERWSLSPLTFPHPLVRVILVEQLYRTQSLLNNHPYHRE